MATDLPPPVGESPDSLANPAPSPATPLAIITRINELFEQMVLANPGGIANRAYTKYYPIRDYIAGLLGMRPEEIYTTGTASRTNQFGVRWSQGRQAGRHTKLGLGFVKVTEPDEDKLDDAVAEDIRASVNTSTKWIDRSENTTYDTMVFFAQANDEMVLRPCAILSATTSDLTAPLTALFPDARVVEIPVPAASAADKNAAAAGGSSSEGLAIPVSGGPAVSSPSDADSGYDWGAELPEGFNYCGLVGVREAYYAALSALSAGKHVIFIGPPGTGKTVIAECLCATVRAPYITVTASAEWSTFETIGGYFPVLGGTVGGHAAPLDFLPGVVTESIQKNCCLIIDEINRADIDKCFGELFTLLSGKSVSLPFKKISDEKFRRVVIRHSGDIREYDGCEIISLPDEWRLLGAMNTFDKASLQKLSFAFMRRFAFVPVDVPQEDDYRTLLEHCASMGTAVTTDEDGSELVAAAGGGGSAPATSVAALRPTILPLFNRLFVGRAEGFQALGLPIGPAIPKDMLRHINQRLLAPDSTGISDDMLIYEALVLYVFPQLQGLEEKHKAIVDMLNAIVGKLSSDTHKVLSDWTGYVTAEE